MKKSIILSLVIVLAALTVACVANAVPTSAGETSADSSPSLPEGSLPVPGSQAGQSSTATLPTPKVTDERLYVADLAMYRGTVTQVTAGVQELTLRLEQAEGTNFGAPYRIFRISSESAISFPAEQLEMLEGRYLEIYHAPQFTREYNPDRVFDAVAVNDLGTAEMVSFNGLVVEVAPNPDKPGNGRILMTDLSGTAGSDTFYLYGEDTQFYLDFDSIKAGDKLNIYRSGAMAMSLPPQCAALEVREYYDNPQLAG